MMSLPSSFLSFVYNHLLPPRLVVILLGAIAGLRALAPGPTFIPVQGAWLSAALGCSGLLLTLRAARQFATERTNIVTFNDPNHLVTRGGFRFSRNPMYLGFALLLCGAAGAAGGTTTWLCPLLFILIAQFVYIPFEERAMTRVFGAQYAAYRRQVRRWC